MEKFPRFSINPKVSSSSQHLASVVISPLRQGFGVTIGNALRRVLLSSIPGAAVFALKINSLSHEFTAIEGVIEDVTTIVLRVKKLVMEIDSKVFTYEEYEEKPIIEWPTLKVSRNSKGIIYAKDFDCPPGVKIINPDLKICELSDDVEFNMELFVTVDVGYRSFVENRERLNTLKIISVDSMFSPVINVEWHVEEEKTTKQGTTDKLSMTVTTNGSIKALDALSLAAHTLSSMFGIIANFSPDMTKIDMISSTEFVTPTRGSRELLIESLGFTARTFELLRESGINTITELVDKTSVELEKSGINKKSLNEIVAKLDERKLKLKSSAK